MKFGLKLWSTDVALVSSVAPLFKKGVVSFLELYAVPGSFKETAETWASLKLPFVIHAPHFGHGLNLSLKEAAERNLGLLREALSFCDRLEGRHILVHLGTKGSLGEAMEQIRRFDSPKIVVENKPQVALDGSRCVGASPEEIETVLKYCGTSFCCDLSHAMKFAAFHRRDWADVLRQFIALSPCQYHLCDGFLSHFKDEHLGIGQGEYDFKTILSLIPEESLITLETPKSGADPLASFAEEVVRLKKFLQ